MKHYNKLPKLVRDKIPEKIKQNGEKPKTEKLTDTQALNHVTRKICEEAEELHKDRNKKELADLMEAVKRYQKLKDITDKELEKMRKQKNKKNGKFNKNIVLKEVQR